MNIAETKRIRDEIEATIVQAASSLAIDRPEGERLEIHTAMFARGLCMSVVAASGHRGDEARLADLLCCILSTIGEWIEENP